MQMKYLAHREQESEREQSLADHLKETAELAGQYAEAFGAYQWDIVQDCFMMWENIHRSFSGESAEVGNR